jgi:hypothetical protein
MSTLDSVAPSDAIMSPGGQRSTHTNFRRPVRVTTGMPTDTFIDGFQFSDAEFLCCLFSGVDEVLGPLGLSSFKGSQFATPHSFIG